MCDHSKHEEKHSRHITIMMSCGVLLIGIIAFGLLATRFFPYIMDDSFILFRYASNLASGQGLVFNPGEHPRSEGIVNPIYLFIISLAPLTGMDIVIFAKYVGLSACLLTAAMIGVIIFKLIRSLTSLSYTSAVMVGCSGAGYFMSNPYVVANAVDGMGTSLAAMTFGIFLLLLVRMFSSDTQPTLAAVFYTGLLATLVPMFRPEMAFSIVAIFSAAFIMSRELRPYLLRSIAVFLLLGSVYFCIRFLYYGLPLPLPFYIKQGGFALYGIGDLKLYLKHVLLLFPFIVVSGAFAFRPHSGKRGSGVFIIALLLALAVQFAYYATLHHIMGVGFRYFQSIAVVYVILAFAGGGILYSIALKSRWKALSVSFLFFAVMIVVPIGKNVLDYRLAYREVIGWYYPVMPPLIKIGQSMKAASQGTVFSIAINDCGAIPFYSGFFTVDLVGLNNRAIALSRTSDAAINEIRKKNPHMVLLFSDAKHGRPVGWEHLSDDDLMKLGYNYAGTLTARAKYHYLVYAISDPSVSEFLGRLALTGVFELTPLI